MLILIFLFWGFEAWLNMRAIAAPVYHENKWMANDKNDYVPLLTAAGKKPADFQAILQLPLVAIGNETVGVARGFWTLREGIHASMETGLPLIDYAMSRTSVSQGLDIIELIATLMLISAGLRSLMTGLSCYCVKKNLSFRPSENGLIKLKRSALINP